MKIRRYAAVPILLILTLGACSSGGTKAGDTPSGSSAPGGAAVTIKLFQFSPTPLQIKAGDQVTWTNTDDIAHTVTSGVPGTQSGVFDSGNFAKNLTFSFTLDKPGTYSYFCRNHNSMRGQIQVS